MTAPIPAWGSGPWGGFSWGGGVGAGTIAVVAVTMHRENAVRIQFTVPPHYTGLGDVTDAGNASNYQVVPRTDTVGLTGEHARDVKVIAVQPVLADDGVPVGDLPRYLDIILDRPTTPFPALYDVLVDNVFSDDLLSAVAPSSTAAVGLFRRIAPPTVDVAVPSRDLANPQTLDAASSLPDPFNPLNLGAFVVDDSGDYAYDEGLISLKKRIFRRLQTRKSAFAHLPGYGIGVKDYGKRLANAAAINSLVTETEAQIKREPEVQFVRVRPILDQLASGLLRLRIAVKTKTGKAMAFDTPFQVAA